MLPKKNRLDRRLLEEIFKRGRSIQSPSLSFRFIPRRLPDSYKISFIAPKSLARFPVHRNHLRRLGYLAVKENSDLLPEGLAGVFVFKRREEDPAVLADEIKIILGRIN